MKTRQIFAGSLLAAVGAALLAPSVSAQSVSYTTGDLLLGFQEPGSSNDYIVDLGPASTFLNAASGSSFTLSLGNIASDLSSASLFGANWAVNSVTQGTNVQWGIIGATSNLFGGTTGSGGTFGLPKNTLFYTQAEPTPGAGSTAPQELGQTTQGTINSKIVSFGSAFNGSTATANSSVATIVSATATESWTNQSPGLNAFNTDLDIEQPTSGTNIGPTNSELDLYELLPTNAGGTGTGKEIGTFSLNSSGSVEFQAATAVPEPGSLAVLGVGAGLLGMLRRRRIAPTA